MANQELLSDFAKEINKDWTSGYFACVQNGRLLVKYNSILVASISKGLQIEMHEDDDDVQEQLEYMITR